MYLFGSGKANECRRMVEAVAAVLRQPPPCHEIEKDVKVTVTAVGEWHHACL